MNIYYLTILTKDNYVITLMTRNEQDFQEYSECTHGFTVNAFFKGGNKYDRTGVLCAPGDADARHLSGIVLDITQLTQDDDGVLTIEPINND